MKIYITRLIQERGIEMLKAKGYEVVANMEVSDEASVRQKMLEEVRDVDAVISNFRDKIDEEFFAHASPRLRIVAQYAVGFDNIDLAAAKNKGVIITNTPDVLTNAVAEFTCALLMNITRRIGESDRFLRSGKKNGWWVGKYLGNDLADKTLGIVGLGRIGSRVAHIAHHGFDMKVVYTDPRPNTEFEKEHGAVYAPNVEALLPQCDFVSLHVPLLDSTRHLINEARLQLMKPTAYLINTARGAVVDEAALVRALTDGTIRGAALDVFEHEPDINSDLLKLENVVLTSHIASATIEARSKMAEVAATNIIEALEGRTPPNLVQ